MCIFCSYIKTIGDQDLLKMQSEFPDRRYSSIQQRKDLVSEAWKKDGSKVIADALA